MTVLIVEDETSVAQNICDLLLEIEQDVKILAIVESVKEAVQWFENNEKPDLALFDIHLADGNSFEIFESVNVSCPVIFTTAFDEYALKAFKVNSVDYLLKPIDKNHLKTAIKKYKAIYENYTINNEHLLSVIQSIKVNTPTHYAKSFLVYIKDKIVPVSVANIAYFYLENDIVYAITVNREKYILDQSLDKISKQVNPADFFRANRQFILSRKAIKYANSYFNRKLKVEVVPPASSSVVISKLKATEFKKWLEGD